MIDYIPQLIIYVFIAAITPGPNNTIAFYTSYNFGIKNSLHIPIAATIGVSLIQLLCCIGLGSILLKFPIIQSILKVFGCIYLIYLAYQISKFKISKNQQNVKKINFFECFLFQFMNPKLYVFASTTSVIFTNYSYNFLLETFAIVSIMGGMTIIAISIWIFLGNFLLKLFNNDVQRKIINYTLSLFLLATAIWIFTS
ncbi:MAG: hypothetical protein CMI92_01125 [Pelagibacteraceae bacterium]|nr:hypothetical protein [Pelagibacteraceae bacterium]|tara:strand:- start:1773 stop:2366 length:594 start_codon:yes stop_codon:yes gene_type:complete